MLADWNLPFRALVDAAPDGIVVCDPHGKILVVNGEAERMFGYAHDALLGLAIDVLVPTRLRGRHAHHVAGYVAAPRLRTMGQHLDLRGCRKDGSEFPVEISLSPVETERGQLVIAGVRDVTERRRLEHENKRASAYLLSAVEAVQEAFLLYDEHDRVTMMNGAARQLAGFAADAPRVGRTCAELFRDAIADQIYDLEGRTPEEFVERRLAYHRDPVGTLDLRTRAGRHLRITDRKTADHGTVSTIADITDDIRRSDELRHAREAAEAASAAKSEFLASMSHELRTPLNAILGFAQLLERDRKHPLDERQLDRLGYVLRGGEHLLRLIDDVLDLAQIEAGRVSVSIASVDVRAVVAEVARTLEPIAQRARIRLAIAAGSGAVSWVLADPMRLTQVVMNFGSNAIKYGKPDGHVEFRIETDAARVRVVVMDDGIGIPDDKRDQIFDAFQRAGQEAGPIQGTGIGLAISKRLASLMQGSVGFRSEAGHGSEFWVELARLQDPAPIVPVVAPIAADSLLATPTGHHVVVYVEDNLANIAFMRAILDDLPTVDLVTATTAEVGLELIRARRPSVVILDLNLPGISGFEALRRLREAPETRDVPVIGLSAAVLPRDTLRGAAEAGFDRYLTKPVKVEELLRALDELLVARH